MIVSGGKIIAIGKAQTDGVTLSGNGVETPLGINEPVLEKINGALPKEDFNSWSGQTAGWDIEKYTGRDGIGIDDHEIYVSGKYMFSSGMSAYAESAWVDETFLKKTDKPDVPEYLGGYGIERSEVGDDFKFDFSGAAANNYISGDGTVQNPFGLDKEFTEQVNMMGYEIEQLNTASARWDTYSADKMGRVISSDESITVNSAQLPDGSWQYDLQVEKVPIPPMVGNDGLSAQYNTDAQKYEVGVSGNLVDIESSGDTVKITSKKNNHFNLEIEAGKLEFANFNSEQVAISSSEPTSVPLTMLNHSDGFNLSDLSPNGLYHVDLNLEFMRLTNQSFSTETIQLFDNNSSRIDIGPMDDSLAADVPVSVNVSYDFMQGSYDLKFKADTVGWAVRVVRFDIHRIFDRNLVGDIIADATKYTGIDGINVNENDHTIGAILGKGLTIDGRDIAVLPSSGIGANKNNGVYAKLSSGLAFNENGQIYVNISSGLKYDPNGNIITVDEKVEGVVETVMRLKKELDGKLTTNMNVSDAKLTASNNSPIPGNADRCAWGGALFTVPLQHDLTTESEISFMTHTQLGVANDTFPIVLGILEYNFDYYDPDRGVWRSQTSWIGDTGPIWQDTADVNGKTLQQSGRHTYKLKNLVEYSKREAGTDIHGNTIYNEIGPTLRSDRCYYLVWFARKNNSMGHITSDEGYQSEMNSDPYFSIGAINTWWVVGTNSADLNSNGGMSQSWYQDLGDALSFSGLSYWAREGEGNMVHISRPFVMIRNVKRRGEV
jgi:hypothetical protein